MNGADIPLHNYGAQMLMVLSNALLLVWLSVFSFAGSSEHWRPGAGPVSAAVQRL